MMLSPLARRQRAPNAAPPLWQAAHSGVDSSGNDAIGWPTRPSEYSHGFSRAAACFRRYAL